jgi:uronate dehydrogenase
MPRILLTGAAGGIGTWLRKLLPPFYPDLVLSDRVAPTDLNSSETFVAADLADPDAIAELCKSVDGILHFGGYSVEGPWQDILQANIIGCHNLFEGARKAGVTRVVFASSNHVVGFYPRARKIGANVTARPDSRYGVSKVFGEAMGALYADKHGLRVTCLRIGNVAERPVDLRRLAIWLAPQDLVQLCRIGLEHPAVQYEVVYGASRSSRCWWDNSRAHELGYRPIGNADDFEHEALAAQAKLPPDSVGDKFQGGAFCSADYDAEHPA